MKNFAWKKNHMNLSGLRLLNKSCASISKKWEILHEKFYKSKFAWKKNHMSGSRLLEKFKKVRKIYMENLTNL